MQNPAVDGPLPVDSPHVMAATNVRRGATPPTWQDSQDGDFAGQWEAVPPGGPAGRDGKPDGAFEDGPDRWTQM